jgi:DNA-binding HxlR family transcriptional regulator
MGKKFEIWYNLFMDETNQLHTGEETEACAPQAARYMVRAMNLLGDMWTLAIVYNLMSGPRRFGELLEAMGNVSPKTVSQRLKMLEQKGFVERRAFAEIPPRVEYHLLEKGRALMDVIEAIRQFGEHYLADEEGADSHPLASPSEQTAC